ncbi:MAG: hypothetical protein IKU38_07135 [Clostridia bacterium]|nr:hypothetical protein [Clostridia bacterium]
MKKRKNLLQSVIGVLIGAACASVLFAAFYGAMAYQLAGEKRQAAPAAGGQHALLSISGAQFISEQTMLQEMGGEACTVSVRLYRGSDGLEIEAVSASPAAYIERLAREKWTAQLMTGFTLAGMEAVYSVRGGEGVLSAREGERIYMLRAAADERTLYALGADARLE